MESLAVEPQAGLQGRSPAGFDELEVAVFVGPVDFVAHDGVSRVCEVDSDLVHAPCARGRLDEGKAVGGGGLRAESGERLKGGKSSAALGMDALFEPDFGGDPGALAQEWRVNHPLVVCGPAEDNGEVTLADGVRLHLAAEGARGISARCHQSQAAGFPVEAVDDRDASAIHTFKSKEITKIVPERFFIRGFAGMRRHLGRLFDDQPLWKLFDNPGAGSGRRATALFQGCIRRLRWGCCIQRGNGP